jgi:hypothetical protein
MESNKFDSEIFKNLIKENITKADKLHKQFTHQANQLGYIRDNLKEVEPYWAGLADSPIHGGEVTNTLNSGFEFMGALNEGLDNIEFVTSNLDKKFTTLTTSTDTAFASAATMSTVTPVENVSKIPFKPCPFIKQKGYEYYAKCLEKMNFQLAKTYRQTWEALHGTRAEPERAAMFQIRQTYDHFFEILAPDDEVRKSKFWKRKNGEKPDQINRHERIEYAAHTHIKDKNTAKLLSANVTAILQAYRKLNKAHKRGKLDPIDARQAINAIDKIIKE